MHNHFQPLNMIYSQPPMRLFPTPLPIVGRILQILSNVPQMFPYLGRFDSSPAALSIRGYEMLCPLYFRAVVEQSDLILRLD